MSMLNINYIDFSGHLKRKVLHHFDSVLILPNSVCVTADNGFKSYYHMFDIVSLEVDNK